MKTRFILFRRSEVYYCEDTTTGKQLSLRTKVESEAFTLLHAKNEAVRQPALNLQIAKAYLAGTDNGVNTRTWQIALEALTNTKQGESRERWLRVAKDPAMVPLLPQVIIETKGETLLKVMQAGTQ